MDNQIKNELRCSIKTCNEVAIGVFANSWICGRCLMKIENKMRENSKKLLELIEDDNN